MSGDQGAAFDAAAALAHLDGDAEFLRQLAWVFVEEWARHRAAIEQALAAADLVTAAGAAHAVKGSLGVFTTGPWLAGVAEVEQAALAADAGAARSAWDRLLPALDAFVAAVTRWAAAAEG